MEEFEKERGGVTIGDIFRTIFSQKWIALIIAATITVVGTLGIYFMGKGKKEFSVAFVLQLPNSRDASSTSYTYPDGEIFYFTDLISSENLKKVASRDEFKNIDVDTMVKRADISIARTIDRVDNESQGGVYDLNYTIKAKAKYFENEDEARDFIEALTSFPREHIISMEIDYDQSLTTSKSAITYREQLTLLRNQAYYIQSIYGSLIGAYGGEFVVDSGKTLAQYKAEIDAYISQDFFSALIENAEENSYVKANTESKLKYESDLYLQKLALERAKSTLKGLTDFQQDTSSTIIHDEIISLNREIATLEQQIKILTDYIAAFDIAEKIAPPSYEAEVAKVEAAVTSFTEGIKPVASYVYGRVTKINYLSTKIVEVDGGYSLMMSGAVGLVAGLVIAAIVAYIVGWSKQKKAEAVQISSSPAYVEAQLQAAATDAAVKEEKDGKNEEK